MDVVMLISWSHYYNRRGMFMIEKLEEYGRFLFGWAFRAMQSEMTMQESRMQSQREPILQEQKSHC